MPPALATIAAAADARRGRAMILTEMADFRAALPAGRAICGLDLGDKTIGVAVSDLRRTVATPIHVIRRVKFTEDAAACWPS